jgi:hypothetical protein
MNEAWLEFENTGYFISTTGFVKNNQGKILKTKFKNDRYHRAPIRINNKMKKMLLHRLVAKIYIPNPDNLETVNHKDGNKDNNNVENLEWCSRENNTKHAWVTGLTKKNLGEKCGSSALDDINILVLATMINHYDKNKLAIYLPSRNSAKPKLKTKLDHVRKIKNGILWPHLNYLFKSLV